MLHASWRGLFNYEGTPESVIDTIINLIGKKGTLVMPCYGRNKFHFDVDKDVSAAGVLSETFRNYEGVRRSHGSHFACVVYGKNTEYIINEHEFSKYGFDEYSPYAKFVKLENSKIIMMGLGKKSEKLSLYHLPEIILKDENLFYKNLFKKKYSSHIIYRDKGKVIEKTLEDMLLREDTWPNKKI